MPTKKKRLVIFGFRDLTHSPRGIERVISHQIEALRGTYEMFYLVHLGKVGVSKNRDVISIGIGRNYFSLNVLLVARLRAVFRLDEKYDLCAHNVILGLMFSAQKVYVHDLVSLQAGSFFARAVLGFLERKYLKLVPKIITISMARKEQLISIDGVEQKKITVVHNTVSFPTTTQKLTGSQCSSKINILAVRSLEKRANLFWYVSFLAQLIQQSPSNISATIVGGGPLFSQLKAHIRQLRLEKHINLTGFVPEEDLIALYERASIVVVPSKSNEGFGLPVIEGYFFNKPVFVNNVEALPEVVISPNFVLPDDAVLAGKLVSKFLAEKTVSPLYREYFDNAFAFDNFKANMQAIFVEP